MNIVCVGGGPAGLYFAVLAKLRNRGHDITVIERNPAGVTYGWGVVFWDDLLDKLYSNDPVSAREIHKVSVLWGGQEVHVRGEHTAYLGGYGYSLGRKRLLDILVDRARGLGVDVQFEREVKDLSEFPEADLIIACDGVNSSMRALHSGHFQTDVEVGRNKYIWLGTHQVFDSFTFAFEETAAGWIWFHAYPFDAETSTLIVECSPETWAGLGFDELESDQSVKLLSEVFERYLDNHSLINQARGVDKAPWLNFRRISNNNWYCNNVVLMGDAAHTTHFAIGSGTKLAIADAIALAGKLEAYDDLTSALHAYQEDRRGALLTVQHEALNSTKWFENVPRYIDQQATQFAYSLWRRRGHYSLWRYQLHLATQIAALRRLRRSLGAARRGLRARRRAKLAQTHQHVSAARYAPE
ncbi:MAG: FAD-dependent monooxygenase [Actinomycetota bacterium]|nr:FAD-dependent monooxygenase [Actinomycetota bacterium]